MNVSNVISMLNGFKDFFSKKNNLALYLEKHLKNKLSRLVQEFFVCLFVMIILILNIMLLFKKSMVIDLFRNEIAYNIFFGVITFFDSFALLSLFYKLIDIKSHFCDKNIVKSVLKQIKSDMNSFDHKIKFDNTIKQIARYKYEAFKNYFIQSIFPIIMIAFISMSIVIKTITISKLITYLLFVVFTSFFVALNHEKTDKVEFIVSKIYNDIPKEKIIGTAVVSIDDTNYYISENNNFVIYFDNVYIELKLKSSLYVVIILNIIRSYIDEYIHNANELLHEVFPDENKKQKMESSIKNIEEVKKELELLVL